MANLKIHEIETKATPAASVIWLHGLGSNGYDFEPIIPELKLPSHLGIRFIFPHAPTKVITINGGLHMPAWYDIFAYDLEHKVDAKELIASANDIGEIIQREIDRGIPSERIIIAGFSQGGAVAYHLALSYPYQLGGLIALSSYLATKDKINYHAINQSMPIFIGHGIDDNIVYEALGAKAKKYLVEKKYKVNYKTYPMGHSVSMEEVKDISRWLQIRLT